VGKEKGSYLSTSGRVGIILSGESFFRTNKEGGGSGRQVRDPLAAGGKKWVDLTQEGGGAGHDVNEKITVLSFSALSKGIRDRRASDKPCDA